MAKVLVVYCSMSGNTKAAAEAVADGASQAGARVTVKAASEAQPEDLRACDAVALGSYDLFDFMGGDLKFFLDRTADSGSKGIAGKSYAAFLTCGGEGRAIASIEAMAQALKLKSVAPSVRVQGCPDAQGAADLKALGGRLAKAAK
jgi:NAD(P)H dehydrogenase (quinone)